MSSDLWKLFSRARSADLLPNPQPTSFKILHNFTSKKNLHNFISQIRLLRSSTREQNKRKESAHLRWKWEFLASIVFHHRCLQFLHFRIMRTINLYHFVQSFQTPTSDWTRFGAECLRVEFGKTPQAAELPLPGTGWRNTIWLWRRWWETPMSIIMNWVSFFFSSSCCLICSLLVFEFMAILYASIALLLQFVNG